MDTYEFCAGIFALDSCIFYAGSVDSIFVHDIVRYNTAKRIIYTAADWGHHLRSLYKINAKEINDVHSINNRWQ